MKGIINRRASKRVTSNFRDNRSINRIIDNMRINDMNKLKNTDESSEKKGGNNDVK